MFVPAFFASACLWQLEVFFGGGKMEWNGDTLLLEVG